MTEHDRTRPLAPRNGRHRTARSRKPCLCEDDRAPWSLKQPCRLPLSFSFSTSGQFILSYSIVLLQPNEACVQRSMSCHVEGLL